VKKFGRSTTYVELSVRLTIPSQPLAAAWLLMDSLQLPSGKMRKMKSLLPSAPSKSRDVRPCVYANLTGNPDGWTPFRQQLDNAFPLGSQSGVTDDNPYPLP
jgi:hypothetical protein